MQANPAHAPHSTGQRTLARFELRQVLGQGAQSVVWLAFDPRLEREVAIKLMKPDKSSSASTVAQWLQEARSVSRLTHPNIVALFEADVHQQQPYLVFEYVAGQTLAEILRKRGALSPIEAVGLMLDVLEALVLAHDGGIVHRDLKPSNVLVDGAGRARVMDFGIAARVQAVGLTGSALPSGGTPGYMSPEAAGGAEPSPSMDIFAAALVLAEMLIGKPLVAEDDPYRAIYRVLHEQLQLPPGLDREVDDALRGIVLRGLTREPGRRQPDARVLRDELRQWLSPRVKAAASDPDAAVQAGGSGTLGFLLRKMRHKSDFPAMSDSVVRIQSIVSSDKESVGGLTNEILKDVALTNKLLRLVNSAHYAHSGSISTVSRAVNLIGFNGVRNMALSLVLLEHMQDKAHASLLRGEFLRSLMAGAIAAELCPVAKESEEAFIGSLFQNLGRLLTEFYFPEEAAAIRGQVKSQRQPLSEAAASASVLGLNFEELGIGVAKAWGLPDSMQRCMRRTASKTPGRADADADPIERVRWLAVVANEMSDTLLETPPEQAQARLADVARRHARTLGMPVEAIGAATDRARLRLIDMAGAMALSVQPGSNAARLLLSPQVQGGRVGPAAAAPVDALVPHELHATIPAPAEPAPADLQAQRRVADLLAAGIADISNAMVEDVKLSDVLRMILETMFRAMDFRRVVFCMRDARGESLTGRFGLGQGVEKLVPGFKVALKTVHPDLFTAVCLKGVDTLISDATEQRIAQRLPDWYRANVNAPTFLLLPLHIKAAPFGLIYADMEQPAALQLDERELSLLRTLRNQAVMALRQTG